MHSLQLSTQSGHVLVLPVGAAHYLIVLTGKDAPLELITVYMQRLLDHMEEDELAEALQQAPADSDFDDFDVDELIDAVSEWLRNGGDSTEP